MDHMERFKIQGSIKRAIEILDSIPPQRDLVPEANTVNLIDPLSTAHLAIERALKALISDAGGTYGHTHGLNKLYRCLGDCNQEIFQYLAKAFNDAVGFFGYNVNVKGLRQFRSIEEYLAKVGTERTYQQLRYWAIEESTEENSAISYISLQIHRELLWALWVGFWPKRRDTVSIRVEREVTRAIERQISFTTEDQGTELPIARYMNWMAGKHRTHCAALKFLVRVGFAAIGDAYLETALRKSYDDLRQSADPAVRYYLGTLTYLPRGSQRRNRDATPEVEWANADMTSGVVMSLGGSWLGIVQRCADGAWAITPSEEGLVQITDIAEALADAKHYLVSRLTRVASCVVNGERREMRLCIYDRFGFWSTSSAHVWNSTDSETDAATYDVEFWDACHGVKRGDRVSIGISWNEDDASASVLYGIVGDVENQKVSIIGSDVWILKRSLEEWLERTAQG